MMEVNISTHLSVGRKNSEKDLGVWPDEILLETVLLSAVNLFLSCTALIGNVLILATILNTSSLHTAANFLLANLAVSDLAVGLVGHPLFVTALLVRLYHPGINGVSPLLWRIFNTVISFSCGASFFTITAIGVDRLLALQLHLRYVAIVTPFRVGWIIFLIWVVSGVFSSVRLYAHLSYNALSPIIFTLLVGNSAVYLKVYLIVRRHLKQVIHREGPTNRDSIFSVQRFKRSALNTFLVYILMLCCYLPYSLVLEIFFKGIDISLLARHLTTTIVLLNSSLNPLLYYWRVREIRSAMKHYFCR